MTGGLPVLPTSVVGNHARPGWLVLGRDARATGRRGPMALWHNSSFAPPREYRPLFPALLDARRDQLRAMVAGTRLVRRELGMS